MNIPLSEDHSEVFRRIERTTLLLASHPYFPGKAETLERCRDDVEERFQDGLLTVEQRARLLRILGQETAVEPHSR